MRVHVLTNKQHKQLCNTMQYSPVSCADNPWGQSFDQDSYIILTVFAIPPPKKKP